MDTSHGPPAPFDNARDWLMYTRQRIEHENGLIDQRLSWLVTSQAIFAAAYVLRFDQQANLPAALEIGLPLVALVVCLTIFVSILAAVSVFGGLVKQWTNSSSETPDVLLWGPGRTLGLGLLAPIVLPMIFIVAWLIAATSEVIAAL